MADEKAPACPDCGGEMSLIHIFDKTHISGGYHYPLEYALPGTTPSFWTGKFPVAGTVVGFMCGGCGRISLYGVPKKTDADG